MSKNLEDPAILQQVKKVSKVLGALGVTVPAVCEAATQAYLEAVKHPGSEIRIMLIRIAPIDAT